jgi:hypothetical protein
MDDLRVRDRRKFDRSSRADSICVVSVVDESLGDVT